MRDEIYERELGWMELVSKTLLIFSQNIEGILLVMAVVFLPISLLDSIILERLNAINLFLNSMQTPAMILENRENIMQATYRAIADGILSMAVALFLQPVGTIAIAKMVKQRIDGVEPSAKKALKEALALEPVIIVSGLISGALITLGSIVIIPGIWLSILWVLYLYCIGLRGRKGWDALRHSAELVRGRWWRTFGYLFVLGLIGILWNMVFRGIYIFAGTNHMTTALYNFLAYFSFAFITVGEALLFINREAQDIGWQFFGEKEPQEIE